MNITLLFSLYLSTLMIPAFGHDPSGFQEKDFPLFQKTQDFGDFYCGNFRKILRDVDDNLPTEKTQRVKQDRLNLAYQNRISSYFCKYSHKSEKFYFISTFNKNGVNAQYLDLSIMEKSFQELLKVQSSIGDQVKRYFSRSIKGWLLKIKSEVSPFAPTSDISKYYRKRHGMDYESIYDLAKQLRIQKTKSTKALVTLLCRSCHQRHLF
ncbi:hypothetical protein N9O57_01815 [bacterium]|nr:hypothetical protein [bacterium]